MPSARWSGIAWNGTVFCAISGGQYSASTLAATSPDGITWTPQTLPTSNKWTAIAWNGSYFCILNYDGNASAISTDGVTWIPKTLLGATGNWLAIAADPARDMFVGVKYGSNVSVIIIAGVTPKIASTLPTVASVVSDLCLRAGLTSGQIDATNLASITRTVRSLALSQVAATRTALELLMSAYFFEMVTSDKIYFRARGAAPVATIPYLELGAAKGEGSSEPLALKQANELELPSQIALTYCNVSDDYQTDTQYSDRLVSAASGTVSTVQMALGMTPAEAKAVVDTMLADQARSVVGTKIALLGDYCRLEPTDTVTVTGADGSTYRLRLVKKTDAYPLLEFEAVLDDASLLVYPGVTSEAYTPSVTVAAPAVTLMQLLDIPILQDADDDAGFYVAAKGDIEAFPGAAIFNSADAIEYTRRTIVASAAVFGTCTTTLGNWTGPRVFDEVNAVTVNVGLGTLSSSTRDALLNSLSTNAILIGSEILQFCTATLVSPGLYTLSGLLRGARGTEWAMSGHAASERAVLLRAAGLARVVLTNSELGLSRSYKGVTLGQALSSATAESFTDNAVGLKPFSPFDLRAARDGANNVTFTWQRRTRLDVRTTGPIGINVPLGEDAERYDIDIYASGAYSAVLRTIVAATTMANYSAADQTADGLTPGDALYARLYQHSTTVGRGYALEQSV
ncbi:MAG: phage tail protein [Proteobacteria bacterium]|nr:phage tail protein [Pseudomonadota bacterium]